GLVDVEIARTALEMQGIDELGLDGFDRRYLETIQRVFAGGPVGIEAIAHTMSSAPDTLEDDVEPFLLRCELVVRTPRGRRLTPRGEEHLGTPPKIGPQGRLF
ncbi:MAG: Holliday junction DNA helicase RuvB C-terminal domain-containing protein, partial [Planctomycetia bacterium]